MTLAERISNLEERLLFIEEQLGITSDIIKIKKEKNYRELLDKKINSINQVDSEPERTVGGFTKDQLRIMFTWAKALRLNQLTKGDFEELKKWEMLKDFYPDAPENYEDIKR
jgi:hypothetical protein